MGGWGPSGNRRGEGLNVEGQLSIATQLSGLTPTSSVMSLVVRFCDFFWGSFCRKSFGDGGAAEDLVPNSSPTCCSVDLELGRPGLIRTMGEHVRSPVLSI